MQNRNILFFILGANLLLCFYVMSTSAFYINPDDNGKFIEPRYDSQALAKWLLEAFQQRADTHKRNSEIINSILGLDRKKLEDAGRR